MTGNDILPYSKEKWKSDSCVRPLDYLKQFLEISEREDQHLVPSQIIICLEKKLFETAKSFGQPTRSEHLPGNLIFVSGRNNSVGVCGNVGVGAPALALLIEDLIALGAKKIIAIGTAGILENYSLNQCDARVFVCEKAVRCEGTSRHYLKKGQAATASQALTEKLASRLDRHSAFVERVTSWSTDAPYRETVEEIEYYRSCGVRTVDMEASAMFAVAIHKGIELSVAFAPSDYFKGNQWFPCYKHETLHTTLLSIFTAALETFEMDTSSILILD